MKKIFLLYALVLIFLTGCSEKGTSSEESLAPSCCTKEISMDTCEKNISDFSLYNLNSDWIRQDGKKIRMDSFHGRPQMIALIYTSCSYACPRIIADLKKIEQELSGEKIENYGIVLVTMDPGKDTPERLREFAAENAMAPAKWVLLNGDQEDVRELSVLLNVKYKKTEVGNIDHSNIITVLNEKGEIVYQEEGLGEDSKGTMNALRGMLKTQQAL